MDASTSFSRARARTLARIMQGPRRPRTTMINQLFRRTGPGATEGDPAPNKTPQGVTDGTLVLSRLLSRVSDDLFLPLMDILAPYSDRLFAISCTNKYVRPCRSP